MNRMIVYIHGVTKSDSRAGYSNKFKEELGDNYDHYEYNWSHLINEEERSMVEEYKKEKGFVTDTLGMFMLMFGADATTFKAMSKIYVNDLRKKINLCEPIVFVAHSMGIAIAIEYMKKYSEDGISHLICLGNNLSLFLGVNDVKHLKLPIDVWNEKNDPMGWTNKRKMPDHTKFHTHRDWMPFRGQTWAVHSSYWKSRKLARKIGKIIK